MSLLLLFLYRGEYKQTSFVRQEDVHQVLHCGMGTACIGCWCVHCAGLHRSFSLWIWFVNKVIQQLLAHSAGRELSVDESIVGFYVTWWNFAKPAKLWLSPSERYILRASLFSNLPLDNIIFDWNTACWIFGIFAVRGIKTAAWQSCRAPKRYLLEIFSV